MRVLLDTCVISEVRRSQGHPKVREQVQSIRTSDIFLSVVTLGELTCGITRMSASPRKGSLTGWLLALEQDYGERILPVDAETARIWGELTASAQARGKTVPTADGLIAATAIRHGLHVMTRNVSDFRETGAMLLNPWEGA